MKFALFVAAAVAVVAVGSLLGVRAAAPLPDFFFLRFDRGGGAEVFFDFRFSRVVTPDISGGPGSSRWVDGKRQAYQSAYVPLEHQDPGFHGLEKGVRFFVQGYGACTVDALGCALNDKYMGPTPVAGGMPYPYEKTALVPLVDKTRPGGVVRVFHIREAGCQYCGEFKNTELLRKIVVPAVSPENPNVRWYYQLGGLFVAEHSAYGPIARIIFSTIAPAGFSSFYVYDVEGVD